MQLSIIILSYNTKDLVIKCLETLRAQFAEGLRSGVMEILVVDNHSTDETVLFVNSYKKQAGFDGNVRVIQNEANFGFAKGNNIGVSLALGEYALLLNSDTQVLDKGFLSMVEYLKTHPEIGILGGKLVNSNGSNQASASKFYTLFNSFLFLIGCERLGAIRKSPKKITKVDWVSGACMLFRKKWFEEIGGFDEQIFMYLEDMELCYRAKKKGFATCFYPAVTVRHVSQGSSNRTFAILHIFEGLLYFYKKYKPQWQYNFIRFLLHTKAYICLNVGHTIGNKYLIDTYGQAMNIV